MTDDEVREWVRGRLAFEAWLRSLHAARDESAAADELRPRHRQSVATPEGGTPTERAA